MVTLDAPDKSRRSRAINLLLGVCSQFKLRKMYDGNIFPSIGAAFGLDGKMFPSYIFAFCRARHSCPSRSFGASQDRPMLRRACCATNSPLVEEEYESGKSRAERGAGEMLNFEGSMFKNQRRNPESRLLNPRVRATSNDETNQIPERFFKSLQTDQISRVSPEVDNLTT
jgi:hypothetical protein